MKVTWTTYVIDHAEKMSVEHRSTFRSQHLLKGAIRTNCREHERTVRLYVTVRNESAIRWYNVLY